jgi:hypothetical protein
MEEKAMKLSLKEKENNLTKNIFLFIIMAAIMSVFAVNPGYAAKIQQQKFTSPDSAFGTMITAVKAGDSQKLAAIFGPGSKDIFSADQADEERRERFVKAYEEKHRLEMVGQDKVILHVGNNDWPWPVTLVKKAHGWRFDTVTGIKEIIARRIGHNEVSAVQVCLAYVDAQSEYAKEHTDNGLAEYAQQMISDPGKKNGLLWESKNGENASPLGPLIAGACKNPKKELQTGLEIRPYHGYFYKILKSQGKDAVGGAYSYIVDGKMIGGFALVAYPAQYGSSGITTFIVNQQGVVYQKDMGKDTQGLAEAKAGFSPDATWKKVD